MYSYHHHIQLPTQFHNIVWSPDGELLALAGINGGVFIVTKANRFVSMLQGYIGIAESFSWSPDGRKIVCADTMHTDNLRYTDIIQTVRIWDVATGMVIQNLYSSHNLAIRWVKWTADGRFIIMVSFQDVITIWDAPKGLLIQEYVYQDVGYALRWVDDSQTLFAIGYDATIGIWQAGKAIVIIPFYLANKPDQAIDYYPPKNWVVFPTAPRQVAVWDATDNREMFRIDLPFIPEFMLWHPHGDYLVGILQDYAIYFWDSHTGKRVKIAKSALRYPNNIIDFCFSPSGDYLAGISQMGSIYVWDGNNGNLIDKIEATDKSHLSELYADSLHWSPTNNYLVAKTTDGSPIVWKFDSRLHFIFDATMNFPDDTSFFDRNIHHPNANGDKVAFVELDYPYNDDGDVIENTVIVIQTVYDGRILHRFTHHKMPIYVLAWHPTHDILASGGNDHTIAIWDIISGELKNILWMSSSVIKIEWSPDGRELTTTSVDGLITVWQQI